MPTRASSPSARTHSCSFVNRRPCGNSTSSLLWMLDPSADRFDRPVRRCEAEVYAGAARVSRRRCDCATNVAHVDRGRDVVLDDSETEQGPPHYKRTLPKRKGKL